MQLYKQAMYMEQKCSQNYWFSTKKDEKLDSAVAISDKKPIHIWVQERDLQLLLLYHSLMKQ